MVKVRRDMDIFGGSTSGFESMHLGNPLSNSGSNSGLSSRTVDVWGDNSTVHAGLFGTMYCHPGS